MKQDKLADLLDRFANAVADLSNEMRDGANDAGVEQDDDGYNFGDDEPQGAVDEAPVNNVTEDTMLQVPAGDLWRLVNRSRKMIRLAREGKIPDMDGRAPLRDAIMALKHKGLVQKPRNLRA